ncbi:amidase [Nocardioides sp.]|uniref:amidase n=1 Tax=Nocardioides sp. TaxID=35761 RepID=UPI0035125D91
MEDYAQHDALGLAALVRSGDTDAETLLSAARSRTAEVNSTLNAVVARFDPPSAPADTPEDAVFAGVPFLLKDLHQDLAGQVTTGGSKALARTVATEDAAVVARWRRAGLQIFGKTNTPEFGLKGITEPDLFGPTRNPWNPEHTPGGSSGGSAAAVAAGIVPVAGASDGGGSIRIPASACGLFGLKPSRGLVPAGPAEAESLGGTATQGVISRSVRDSAAMLDVLAGATPDSPYLPAVPAQGYLAGLDTPVEPLRIGITAASSLNDAPHPEALAALRRTADLLSDLGHDVVELDRQPVDDAALAQDFLTCWFAYLAHTVAQVKELSGSGDSGFEADTQLLAAIGRATSATAFQAAVERRHEHTRALAAFHTEHDLLLTPTTATPPPRIGSFVPPLPIRLAQKALLVARAGATLRFTPIIDQLIRENAGWVPYTPIANLTGRPAMSVPLHWTPDGLPIGSHFVGRLGEDGLLLRLAAQLETAAPWADRRPSL